MKKPNRKCCVCNEEYYYCLNGCNDSNPNESWRATFCKENCKKIYHLISNVYMKKIDFEEAKKEIVNCDLSDFHKYTSVTKEMINKLKETDENKIVSKSSKRIKKEKIKE